ncbi:mitochondrial ribosomal protein L21 [Haematococcus lacustris]|uniref:Large ribosomal subunit protein bL21m n=1 Tax=Haematococcus lacustris TaxID=44745 RepID=A0A699YN09_HAELA|nr:mitochondrial ribosomal protein L21 [Haematococcus lacustris]
MQPPLHWACQRQGALRDNRATATHWCRSHDAALLAWSSPAAVGPCTPEESSHLGQLHFVRHYKSLKKSMKPVYTAVNKRAVRPFEQQPDPDERERRSSFQQAPIVDTTIPDLPTVPRPPEFSRVGVITGEYRLATQPAFAVVQLAGKQYKVTVDDILFVNHLAEATVNEVIALERVLLAGTREVTTIGRPYVSGARVLAAVEEHFKDGKVHVFRFKKRNRYKKYKAPRPHLTTLRILDIQAAPGVPLVPPSLQAPALPIQPLSPDALLNSNAPVAPGVQRLTSL